MFKRASRILRRISFFFASEVNVEGRKLGNFWNGGKRSKYGQNKRQRKFAERDDGEDGERNQSTRVGHCPIQLFLLAIRQLTASNQFPEETTSRVDLMSVEFDARPDVTDSRLQRRERRGHESFSLDWRGVMNPTSFGSVPILMVILPMFSTPCYQ